VDEVEVKLDVGVTSNPKCGHGSSEVSTERACRQPGMKVVLSVRIIFTCQNNV
jgi:hypothetical protein